MLRSNVARYERWEVCEMSPLRLVIAAAAVAMVLAVGPLLPRGLVTSSGDGDVSVQAAMVSSPLSVHAAMASSPLMGGNDNDDDDDNNGDDGDNDGDDNGDGGDGDNDDNEG